MNCPSCGHENNGPFCTQCGAKTDSSDCANCNRPISPWAKFCTECGTTVGGSARTSPSPAGTGNITLAGVGTGALVTLVAVALVLIARDGLPDRQTRPVNNGGLPTAASAPDISSLTPRQQFARLADRIQASLETGDTAKVVQLFPMLEGSFGLLLPGDRDLDARFHMGLLQAETGRIEFAVAQADSILAESPNDLFGFYIQNVVANFQADPAAAQVAKASFDAAYQSEIATGREDYSAHETLFAQFLAQP